jgi:hypothetical protein
MAFTLDTLAQELGIDPSTLHAKSDVVAKWNGYLSEADTKYSQATAAQREAVETLEQAKRDQSAIDDQIQKFGVSEVRVAELESANAAYRSALEKAKESGLNIDLSGIRQPTAVTPADPNKTLQDQLKTGFSQMGAALRAQARYQSVYGKPFTDDPVKLIDEAIAARMPVEQYAEQKYKFGEETEKQRQSEVQAKIDAGVSAGVKKWQEDHPVTNGHPGLARGRDSVHSKIFKPRDAQEQNDFRKMSPRDRIAASVSRVRQAVASSAD